MTDGLEEIRLIAGYGWDPELREVGAAVISLRDGHDKVIWKHELDEPTGGVTTTTIPILPPTGPRPPRIERPGDTGGEQRNEGAQDR